MFDIGFGELILVFIVALLVLGPEQMIAVAKKTGRMAGRAQRYASELKRVALDDSEDPPKHVKPSS